MSEITREGTEMRQLWSQFTTFQSEKVVEKADDVLFFYLMMRSYHMGDVSVSEWE